MLFRQLEFILLHQVEAQHIWMDNNLKKDLILLIQDYTNSNLYDSKVLTDLYLGRIYSFTSIHMVGLKLEVRPLMYNMFPGQPRQHLRLGLWHCSVRNRHYRFHGECTQDPSRGQFKDQRRCRSDLYWQYGDQRAEGLKYPPMLPEQVRSVITARSPIPILVRQGWKDIFRPVM